MKGITEVLKSIQSAVWGIPTMALLLFTGLYLTVRLKGLQFIRLPRAIRYIFEKEEGEGDVSAFASLCTALAATIGTGSIVGVATALRAGGPGALFWMWVSALVGHEIRGRPAGSKIPHGGRERPGGRRPHVLY